MNTFIFLTVPSILSVCARLFQHSLQFVMLLRWCLYLYLFPSMAWITFYLLPEYRNIFFLFDENTKSYDQINKCVFRSIICLAIWTEKFVRNIWFGNYAIWLKQCTNSIGIAMNIELHRPMLVMRIRANESGGSLIIRCVMCMIKMDFVVDQNVGRTNISSVLTHGIK